MKMPTAQRARCRAVLTLVRAEVLAAHTPPNDVGAVLWTGSALSVTDSWINVMLASDPSGERIILPLVRKVKGFVDASLEGGQ